jgi:hypothetical protein
MTLSVNAGGSATAAFIDQIAPLGVVKPTDESVTSSTTMQNDNDLLVSLVANATYKFECYLDYEGGTQGASDIKWQWAIPAGTNLHYQPLFVGTTGNIAGASTFGAATVGTARTNGAAFLCAIGMSGGIIVGSTAGTLQLQWAQNTSSATATTVHASSTLTLWRLS